MKKILEEKTDDKADGDTSSEILASAESLHARLRHYPWFVTIGIGLHEGKEALFVYVKAISKADISFLSDGWEGFPVFVQRTGMPRAT